MFDSTITSTFRLWAERIKKVLLLCEIILVVIILAGYLMKLSGFFLGTNIFVFGLTCMALLYYILAFQNTEGISNGTVIIIKMMNYSMSIACMSFIFVFSHWPGARFIVVFALVSLGLSLAAILLFGRWMVKDSRIQRADLIRTSAYALLTFLFWFFFVIKEFWYKN